jgi:hypothetical protein
MLGASTQQVPQKSSLSTAALQQKLPVGSGVVVVAVTVVAATVVSVTVVLLLVAFSVEDALPFLIVLVFSVLLVLGCSVVVCLVLGCSVVVGLSVVLSCFAQ